MCEDCSRMSHHVCPWWVGYLLLLPMRRVWQRPRKVLGPLIREGMTVLEPGAGMGFFSLDVARMVGPTGRVVALDIQERMLEVLRRRARKTELLDLIDIRLAEPGWMGVADLAGRVDLVLAIFVVHEMPEPGAFFVEARRTLRPGGRLLLAEPRGHVSEHAFAESLQAASRAGLSLLGEHRFPGARAVVLVRS